MFKFLLGFTRIFCFIGWHVDRPHDTALGGAVVYNWECLECGRIREYER